MLGNVLIVFVVVLGFLGIAIATIVILLSMPTSTLMEKYRLILRSRGAVLA